MTELQGELSRAAAAQAAGALPAAVAGYGRVLAAVPGHAEALFNLGVVHLMQGEWEAALGRFDALLAAAPPAPQVLGNRGFALSQLGRPGEALESYDRALALDPGFIDALYSRAVILLGLRRLAEAIAGFDAVLARQPDHPGALANRGQALLDGGRVAEALASLDAAHRLDPGNVGLALHRVVALRRHGRQDAAVAAVQAMLAPWPGDAGVRNEIGNALKALGEPALAEGVYRQALALVPGFAAALGNCGYALLAGGKHRDALVAVRRALAIEASVDLKALFVKCLGTPIPLTSDLRGIVGRGLREVWGRPTAFGAVGLALLRDDPLIARAIDRSSAMDGAGGTIEGLLGGARLDALSRNTLLMALLDAFPLFDPGVERLLTRLRRAALDGVADLGADDLPFLAALARQAFISEYVHACGAAETGKVAALRADIATALDETRAIAPALVAVIAAYGPLTPLGFADRLLSRDWPEPVETVLTQQIREPAVERACAAGLPQLTPIAGDVSLKVRRQYEENPFPRWVRTSPGGRPATLGAYLRESFPFASFDDAALGADLDILIAGCGTGQHSTETAQQFRHREVLAVDLSRASLGYAERKRRDLGLGSLRYAQADIMELGALDRRFGLIESSGVLHHLADPFAGWRVLLSLLAPGGVMHLGLYSALARRWVVEARGLIARRGYGDTPEGIRAFRQDMLAAGDDPLAATIRGTPDFYSASMCRDLLFHVQEHRLTLPEISAFLARNGLRLIGFDTPLALALAYRARFPADPAMADLASWDAFELENPDTFGGMYQFWVQKT